MQTLTFPYRPSARAMTILTIFGTVGAAAMVNEARTNEVGLIIEYFIELSPQHASWFYGFLALCCGAMALIGLLGVIAGLKTPKLITLTDREIIAPKSAISGALVTVPFSSITSIKQKRVQKNDLLLIRHTGGRLTISLGFLQDKAAQAALIEALNSRAPQ